MVKCRAEMRSRANTVYDVRLVSDHAWEGQERFWVVVERMNDRKILIEKSTWSEKEATRLWLAECENLLDSFGDNDREERT